VTKAAGRLSCVLKVLAPKLHFFRSPITPPDPQYSDFFRALFKFDQPVTAKRCPGVT
jgi:hypothetical protein